MHISGLWEQAEVQGEKQPTHRQNMQTSHRKAAGGPQIQTRTREVTVFTFALQCCMVGHLEQL